jgi:hypothetical protein
VACSSPGPSRVLAGPFSVNRRCTVKCAQDGRSIDETSPAQGGSAHRRPRRCRLLHLLVDQLSDAEAEAALTRLSNERELLRQWTATADPSAAEAEWATANAREAIREERW